MRGQLEGGTHPLYQKEKNHQRKAYKNAVNWENLLSEIQQDVVDQFDLIEEEKNFFERRTSLSSIQRKGKKTLSKLLNLLKKKI